MNGWYRQSLISICLIPFSWCYRALMALRKVGYQYNIFHTHRFSVPVIVVGNLTVGGTGKTPLVIHLAHHFLQQGFKPGIVSRGYKGSGPFPQSVTTNSQVQQVGDEPLLMAKATSCPVMVDPKRSRAVQRLIDDYQCDLIISDDGLQHYAMGRDVEICVIDGKRRFGNQHCLPAGPCREPLSRLKHVDFMVVNGETSQDNEYAMQIHYQQLININDPNNKKPLSDFYHTTVNAVAGIGNPQAFFTALQAQGMTIEAYPFADHHRYQARDLQFNHPYPIITTEKDAVKLKPFANDDMWYLPITVQLPSLLLQALDTKIKM